MLAGCGDDDESTRVGGDRLTIYMSAPAHGVSAGAGRAAVEGATRALSDARGRAGGRTIRLVELASTDPGDSVWDPDIVEAGAERATDDPTAIAYLGELDLGGSAISVPVTNRRDLLQVSPADGLTSLTRTPPGRPRAGPERYYPEGRRSFVRLVPTDLAVSTAMLAEIPAGAERSVAVVHTDGFAERELAGMLAYRLRQRGPPPVLVEPIDDDADGRARLVDDLVDKRTRVVLLAGAGGAPSRALLAELGARLPAATVAASPPLASQAGAPGVPERASAITGRTAGTRAAATRPGAAALVGGDTARGALRV